MSLVNGGTINTAEVNGDEETGTSTWPGGSVIIIRQRVGIRSTVDNAIILRQIVSFRSTSTSSNAIILRQNVARQSHFIRAVTLRQRVIDG